MSYALEKIDVLTWNKVVSGLKEGWRKSVIRRAWHEEAIDSGIAINPVNCNYLLSAPTFICDHSSSWYFFYFDRGMYCFRVDCPTKPMIEFYQGEPPPDSYEIFKEELICAFDAFGFDGSALEPFVKIKFAPVFPMLTGASK